MGETARDRVDDHVARWTPILPELDPDMEGAVTRMVHLVRHLKQIREASLTASGMQWHEFDTLHALAGRHGTAAPSRLAADLGMPPNSITGRLDALERHGYVRRTPSPTDRRRVIVEMTGAGRAAWRDAMDTVGAEEERLLGVLTPDELRTLSDLLRRVMLRAERRDDPPEAGPAGQSVG